MNLHRYSEYHLRQMLGAIEVTAQRYMVDVHDPENCRLCHMDDLLLRLLHCLYCPWMVFTGEKCDPDKYGLENKWSRIQKLLMWRASINFELRKRGVFHANYCDSVN